jgi:hypothetical protein
MYSRISSTSTSTRSVNSEFDSRNILLEDISTPTYRYYYDNEAKFFHSLVVPNFAADYYQFLINNGKFKISLNQKGNFYYLSVTDPEQYVINGTHLPYFLNVSIAYRDVVTVSYKNIFDCLKQYQQKYQITLPSKTLDETDASYNKRIYNDAIIQYRKLFNSQMDDLTLPSECNINAFKNNIGVYYPCSSYYGKKKKYHASEVKFENKEDDLIKLNYNGWHAFIDHLTKIVNPEHKIKYLDTIYRDFEGKIKDKIITHEMLFRGKRCFILGTPEYTLLSKFTQENQNYIEVLESQRANYEKDIKDLLSQYHGIKAETVDVCDLIYSILVNSDKKYIDKYGLLTADEFATLSDAIRVKLKELFKDKFNHPNIILEYYWDIVILDKNNKDEDTFYPLIYSLREVDSDYKPIFEKVLDLARNEMMIKWGMQPTNQILAYYQPNFSFCIKTDYLHPLNFLGRRNTFYNRIIPLEELIYSCDKVCNNMDEYMDLPFWSVCPMKYSLINAQLMSYYEQGNYDKFAQPIFERLKINDKRTDENNGFTKVTGTTARRTQKTPSTLSASSASSTSSANRTLKYGTSGFYSVLSEEGDDSNASGSVSNTSNKTKKNSQNNSRPKTKNNFSNINPNNIMDKTQYIYNETVMGENGQEKTIEKRAQNNSELTENILRRLFSPRTVGEGGVENHVIVTYNTYEGYVLFLIKCPNEDGSGFKFYNVFMEKAMFGFNSSKIKQLEKYDNLNYKKYFYGYTGKILRILLVKEYNQGDNFQLWSLHFNLYRMYNNLDTFFKGDTLKLKVSSGAIVEITNPYKYHIVKLISLIHSLFFEMNNKIDYNIFQSINKNSVYEKPKDKKITNNNKQNSIDFNMKRDNNVFYVYKSNKFMCILDSFSDDKMKSKIKGKTFLNTDFFKFTLWIVSTETCNDIYDKIKKLYETGNKQGNIKEHFSRSNLATNIFTASSIKDKILIDELRDILENVKKFINGYFNVSEFDYNVLNINELSDIETTSFHIHIELKSQYFKPLEEIDYKRELLDSKVRINRYPANIQGHFSFETILDKLKTNSDYIYNQSLHRPFSGQLKFAGLFCT